MWKKFRNSALQQSQVLVSECKKLISSGGISKLSCGQKEFSSSHSLLFPPFLPLCWKASALQFPGSSANWGKMCWVLKHDLKGTGSSRHLTEISQPLCGTTQELQPLTKLSSIQNCPVMCLSDLCYNGSKEEHATGTSEELALVLLVVSPLWIPNILRYRFGQHFEL